MHRQPFLTVVVGQNVLLREGLVSILRAAGGFSVLDATCSVCELDISFLFEQQQPILIIVATGDDPSAALQQVKHFKDTHTNGSVVAVVVANRFRLNDVISAFQQGTKAYFLHKAHSDAFIKYLELVMMGETIVPPAILSFFLDHKDDYREETEKSKSIAMMKTEDNHVYGNKLPHLSEQEKAILRCLVTGDSNKAIARKINIAEATVKVYIKTILRKVQVQNRTQAAIWAMRNGSIILAVQEGFKL
jgi:two-component system, NarL family, nitrate/nitrite response regulator NarL